MVKKQTEPDVCRSVFYLSFVKIRVDICLNSDYNTNRLNSDYRRWAYMIKQDAHELLARFNGLYKELDDVYHSLARHYGLSDCALWVLYVIRETGTSYTQTQLCERLSLSKQTINSALKTLEKEGRIRLDSVAGNQKSKQVILTEEGRLFAEKTIDKVLSMELQVFEQFSAEEQAMLFRLLEVYVQQIVKAAQAEIKHTYKES